MDKEQKRFDWGIIIAILGCFIALVTFNLTTYMSLNSKMDSLINEMHRENLEFHKDMREFHARLSVLENDQSNIREVVMNMPIKIEKNGI